MHFLFPGQKEKKDDTEVFAKALEKTLRGKSPGGQALLIRGLAVGDESAFAQLGAAVAALQKT